MRSRTTASAGESSTSLPLASVSFIEARVPAQIDPDPNTRRSPCRFALSLKHYEDVAFADRLALLAANLLDGAVVFGLDRDLHLHRLEDDDGVAVLDCVPDRDLNFPHAARDVRLDVHGGGQYPPCPTPWRQSSPPTTRPTGSARRSKPCARPCPPRSSGSPTTPPPTAPPRWR